MLETYPTGNMALEEKILSQLPPSAKMVVTLGVRNMFNSARWDVIPDVLDTRVSTTDRTVLST